MSRLSSLGIDYEFVFVDGEVKTPEELGHKEPKSMNFFKKFAELQLLMIQHNAGLTASHPYASGPINWPFLLGGISFWTQSDGQKQIYLIGNLVSWWTCVVGLAVFIGILGADLLARRRGIDPIPDCKHATLSNRMSCLCVLLQLCATAFGIRQGSSWSSGLYTTCPSS